MIENRELNGRNGAGCLGMLGVWMVLVTLSTWAGVSADVAFLRVPDGGIQPQAAVSPEGTIHLIYFKGDPFGGNLHYTTRAPGDTSWATSIQVNSVPGSVVAAGTVRGGHLALGRAGRVHAAWMSAKGGGESGKRAMYYTRFGMDRSFEPQRNVISHAYGLDGGGTIAADADGRVHVVWHAGEEGESSRRVYLATSENDGESFANEVAVSDPGSGACGCCGIRAAAGPEGTVYVLYRTAREEIHRDAHLVVSRDGVADDIELQAWELGACPMTTGSILPDSSGATAAWETDGQVYLGRYGGRDPLDEDPVPAPGVGQRKHPVTARNVRGETLLAWTEGTGWKRGGSFGWQVYDAEGRPIGAPGEREGVPVWSLVAAVPTDGGFVIIH